MHPRSCLRLTGIISAVIILTTSWPHTLAWGKTGMQLRRDTSAEGRLVRARISRADLVYHAPVKRPEEGLPIGNGEMGSLVWTIPSAVCFQINRVDLFGNDGASNNFYERNTDYCGGTGGVQIDFGENVFTGPAFSEHLSCYDGLVTVEGAHVKMQVVAWKDHDVMAIRILDTRIDNRMVNIDLSMLRPPKTKRGNHQALSRLDTAAQDILLTQRFQEDSFYAGSVVRIGVEGSGASAEYISRSTVRLMLTKPGNPVTVYIASAASEQPGETDLRSAAQALKQARETGFQAIASQTAHDWHRFWSKSYISLHSTDGVADEVEKNYTYYLYVMGASSTGKYPVKFNGMLWSTDGDTRAWGGAYWGANQSCLYNALFTAGQLTLLDPMFRMYSSMYGRLHMAAVQQWGSQGVYIPETVYFDGPPSLPDSIAREMQALYLEQKPWKDRSEAFKQYAYTKSPYLSRWNWKKDGGWHNGRWRVETKDSSSYSQTGHILARGAKIAYKYWLRYEYTMDTAWLRHYGYPMIKGTAEFYRHYPGVRLQSGIYHIYQVNDNESVWGGHNTVEEIAAMRGILPVAIRASKILGIDNGLRHEWQAFLDHLSPLPMSTAYDATGKPTWVKSLPPVIKGNGSGLPDPNTMPVWYFDLCNPGAPLDRLTIARATYERYFPHGLDKDTRVHVLSRLPDAGVRLGIPGATRFLIPNQVHSSESRIMANRMDEREGKETANVERLGRAAEALQDALCLSAPAAPGADPVIRVFLAWPRQWEAGFSLLAKGNFQVSSRIKDGKIPYVAIVAASGGVCRIANPWPGTNPALYVNGQLKGKRSGNILHFGTARQDTIILVPPGTPSRVVSGFFSEVARQGNTQRTRLLN